jgi:hypothetical protein
LVGRTSNHQVSGTSGEHRQGLERVKRRGGLSGRLPPSGVPVTIGRIDYAENPGAAVLTELSVHGALR